MQSNWKYALLAEMYTSAASLEKFHGFFWSKANSFCVAQ